MGLRMLGMETVNDVLVGKVAENIFVTRMTLPEEFDETTQVLLLLIAPPYVEVIVAVQLPLDKVRSVGRIICTPPPVLSGFLTVIAKL
jgi:hypothetical protein